MKNVLVYVAGAISKGPLHANIVQAHKAGMALLKAGIPCIVPHASCFWGNQLTKDYAGWLFLPEVLPEGTTHADWYGMDLVIVGRCDAVLRLPGESTGADLEVAEAERLGRPVFRSVDEVIAWAETKETKA